MIDCGEGAQMRLRRSRLHFQKIRAVFISHLHGDHCLGLPGLVSTFGMLGRVAPLDIYAPKEYEEMFNRQMDFFCNNVSFDITFHGHDTTRQSVIYEDKSITVETVPLEHRVSCAGFLFREKPTLPHIRRDMIDFYGVPNSQINNIKNGMAWHTDDGITVDAANFVEEAEPPRSYAYLSDTKYMPHLHDVVKNVNVIYHEATYADDGLPKAIFYGHSTARQAAMVARDANVGKLLLGHYSSRYDDESVLLKEAREVFAESYLTDEGKVFEVK